MESAGTKRDNRCYRTWGGVSLTRQQFFILRNPSWGEWQLKILVIMPGDVYDGLLDACPVTSGQYQALKNGIVINDPQYGKAIEILCESIYAEVLLGLAKAIYPDAAPYIEESIRLARKP